MTGISFFKISSICFRSRDLRVGSYHYYNATLWHFKLCNLFKRARLLARKRTTLAPCPWLKKGESKVLMRVVVRRKIKGKGQPWWIFINHKGRRTSKRIGDKQTANELAQKIRAELRFGEYNFKDEKPVTTFKELSDLWIITI